MPNEPGHDKPHLSPSSIETFCQCPERWRRRYIEKERIPPGIAMLRGTGFHGGAAVNFRQKVESHQDLPARDIIDASVAALETRIESDGILYTDEESQRNPLAVIAEARDDTALMAEVHAKKQAPDYQPVLVEQRIRIVIPEATHDLLGYLDLLDDRHRVPDFKTGKKKRTQDDGDTSVALTYYAAAVQSQTGRPVTEVRLDQVVQQQRGVVRHVITSTRGPADFAALAARINAVLFAINAGNFPPAPPGAWWCSERWCGYWSTCPYVNSERKAKSQ